MYEQHRSHSVPKYEKHRSHSVPKYEKHRSHSVPKYVKHRSHSVPKYVKHCSHSVSQYVNHCSHSGNAKGLYFTSKYSPLLISDINLHKHIYIQNCYETHYHWQEAYKNAVNYAK